MKLSLSFFILLSLSQILCGQVNRFRPHSSAPQLNGSAIIRGIYPGEDKKVIISTKQNIVYKIAKKQDTIYTLDQLKYRAPIVSIELRQHGKNWIFTADSHVYCFDEQLQITDYFKLHNQEFVDFQFSDKALWALSKDGQLYSFQVVKGRINGMFSTFPLVGTEEKGKKASPVWVRAFEAKKGKEEAAVHFYDLYIDASGAKWITSDQGLIRFHFLEKNNYKNLGPTYCSTEKNNTLWVGGDQKIWKIIKHGFDQEIDTLCISLPGVSGPVRSISCDANGDIWFAADIVGKYNPGSEQLTIFNEKSNPEFNSKTAAILSYIPARQQVFAGTKGSGLYIFDVSKKQKAAAIEEVALIPLKSGGPKISQAPPSVKALDFQLENEKNLYGKIAFNQINLFKRLNFEADKSIITSEGKSILLQLASEIKRLNQDHNFTVLINGHSSFTRQRMSIGPRADSINYALSCSRAIAVKKQLVVLGIPEYQLEARGFGDALPSRPSMPFAPDNQRVEVILQKREVSVNIENKSYRASINLFEAHFVNLKTQEEEIIPLDQPLVLDQLHLSPKGLGIKQKQKLHLLTDKLRLIMQVLGKPVTITFSDPIYLGYSREEIQILLTDFFYAEGFEEEQLRVVLSETTVERQVVEVLF